MSSKTVSSFRVEQRFQVRIYVVTGFIFFVFFVLVVQLINLQIVKGYANNILAKKFVNRQEFTLAPRGYIYDRHYPESANLLVSNLSYVDFIIYPSRFNSYEEGERYIRIFCRVMGVPVGKFEEFLDEKKWNDLTKKNDYITLIERVSRKEHERIIESHLFNSNGDFIANHLRYYSMGPVLSHVTGYIGYPSRKELEMKLALPYQMIGKGGIEALYDSEIRGTDGVRIRHRVIDSEEQIMETEQGNNLVLTIDKEIQAVAYRSLVRSGLKGSVVAIRPSTGEILALVSQPTFDPNILSSGTSEQRSKHYDLVMDHRGFLNLAIQAKFPPASVFKPLVAIAALETLESGVDENTSYFCPGYWKLKSSVPGVPPVIYNCWAGRGHGHNDLIGAIMHSCNVYFYQLGYKIGPTPIIRYATLFGLDKPTGIDLPGEISGFVPNQRWKRLTWSSRWFDGDTVNLAIGQGFLQTTPMEIALLYSTIVNHGKMYRPHLLKEVREPSSNRIIRKVKPELIKEIPISQHTLDVVFRGMRAVVERGTASFLGRPYYPPIAGKTGTAQTRSGVQGSNHAWFAGFAPYGEEPENQVVVVVFLEYGMGGAATAAPVAGDVLKALFSDWKPKQNDRVAPVKLRLKTAIPDSSPVQNAPLQFKRAESQ